MFYKISITSFVFFTLLNCQSQKLKQNEVKNETPISGIDVGDQNLVYLKEGQNIFLKDRQMNVTFNGIKSDSRCPEGVNCIWAGAATASITVMTTTSRPMEMELSTITDVSKTMMKSQNMAGYNITLEKVLPYPNQKINKADLKGKYQIALRIEK